MIEELQEVIELMREVVYSSYVEGSIKWLFIKSHGNNPADYNDYDLFVIIKDDINIVSTAKHLSKIAVNMTLILDKYVSIYPVYEYNFKNMNNQFLKNLNKKGLAL